MSIVILWGRFAARVQKVQRVQRGRYRRFAAMSILSALRDLVLCHQSRMTESKSLLPQEGGVAVRRRRIVASGLFKIFRTYPQGFAQLLPEEGACVAFFPSRGARHSERSEESRYLPIVSHWLINASRREGAAFGGFSPFGAVSHQRGNAFPSPEGRLYGFL